MKGYLCGLCGELAVVKQWEMKTNVAVQVREVTVVCTTEVMAEMGEFKYILVIWPTGFADKLDTR